MPRLSVNGIALNYDDYGDGPLVVLVMGTGAPGGVWRAHQVPALLDAGYRVVTFDNRGISPVPGQTSRRCPEITIEELVSDLAVLVERLGAPAHVVGTSLGAMIVQELALARPELVRSAVAMGGHARLDAVGHLLTRGEQQLFDQAVALPPAYKAALDALLNLSPATLRDESKVRDWLDMLEFSAAPMTSGERGQLGASVRAGDRREAYRAMTRPMLVIGFADDLMIPAYLGREVAEVAPTARYVEVSDVGHFGYLERPDEVNRLILEFLAEDHAEVAPERSAYAER